MSQKVFLAIVIALFIGAFVFLGTTKTINRQEIKQDVVETYNKSAAYIKDELQFLNQGK